MQKDELKFIEQEIPFRKVPLMDGTHRKVDTHSIVGKCHCAAHKGYLTVILLHRHECVEKGCFHLEKFEGYPYWARREAREATLRGQKARKKRRKLELAAQKQKEERRLSALRATVQKIADELYMPILITRVAPAVQAEAGKQYIVNYVSDGAYNDWNAYFSLAYEMGRRFGGKYLLKHHKGPDGRYLTIRDWAAIKKLA